MVWIEASGLARQIWSEDGKIRIMGAPDFLKRNTRGLPWSCPSRRISTWIGAEDKYQVAIATGQSTKIDYLKLQPPGTRDHGSYGVAAGLQNNFYGLGVNADTIIK
jgi:hypothetical protein